jgi:hypothetical protein
LTSVTYVHFGGLNTLPTLIPEGPKAKDNDDTRLAKDDQFDPPALNPDVTKDQATFANASLIRVKV